MKMMLNGLSVELRETDSPVQKGSYILIDHQLFLVQSLSPVIGMDVETKKTRSMPDCCQAVEITNVVFDNRVYVAKRNKEILPYDLVMDGSLRLYDSPPASIDTELICEYLISKDTKRPRHVDNVDYPFVLEPIEGKASSHKRTIEEIITDLTLIIDYVTSNELDTNQLHKLVTAREQVASLKNDILSLRSN